MYSGIGDELTKILDKCAEEIRNDHPTWSDDRITVGAAHISTYALVESLSEVVQEGRGLTPLELFSIVSGMIFQNNWIAGRLIVSDIVEGGI